MNRSGIHGPLDAHLRAVSAARGELDDARGQRDRVAVSTARHRLRTTVEAARDAGASWMQIGDLMGIARGNAYRQYRRRPARGEAHKANRDAG